MRIAFVAPLIAPLREPHLGGVQTHLVDLAAGLTRRGHEVDVFAASGSEVAGIRVVDTGVDSDSLRGTLFRSGGRGRAGASVAGRAFAAVYSGVAAGGYEIVHNHAFDPPAVRAAAAAVSVPVLHTLHMPPEAAMAVALTEAQRSAHPPVVATVSRFQAQNWGRLLRIDAVLRPGVPTERIPAVLENGSGLLFAGRLSPEKGAVEAIEIGLRAGIAVDLYGDAYDAAYARRVAAMARTAGVTLHPAVERTRLWALMGRARAVLCPSTWEEPFGMVAAEAQAAGAPVVAFRSGGLPEVIVDGTTGVVVGAGDIAAAAAAADRLAGISRAACRGHAVDNLDLAATLTAHEDLYAALTRKGEPLPRREAAP